MRNVIHTLFITLLAAVVLSACNKNNKEQLLATYNTGAVSVKYPDITGSINVSNEKLVFTNISTGEKQEVMLGDNITMLVGIYDCEYSANATIDGVEGTLYGTVSSVIIKNSLDLSIESHLVTPSSDLIIEEIFFTGTLQPSGKQYRGDNYVKLYNPTDHVLYADGVALCESKFTSTAKYDYNPDIRNEAMTVQAVYVIPGSGTERPVEPGQSIVICDIGIDHRVSNPNSFDLSNADFEWYDISTSPSNMDIDSETVPNLDKWYCYTLSIWILHNRGFKSYAIARIPIDKETYLKDYYYTYDYTMHLEAGDFYMTQSAYKLPNEWIIDGVNCSVEPDRQWNILPPQIDAGWTHCGKIDGDKDRYSKSVRRKVIGYDKNGNRILKDTNNSTADFEADSTPSLLEEQSL